MYALADTQKLLLIATTSGEEVGLRYREPTTQEMHHYQAESVQRVRNKIQFRHSEAQMKFGNAILEGIRDGDFGVPGPDGKLVPISSDPASPQYRKDWKDLLNQYAPAVVIALGQYVFGGTEALASEGTEDEAEPLGKN